MEFLSLHRFLLCQITSKGKLREIEPWHKNECNGALCCLLLTVMQANLFQPILPHGHYLDLFPFPSHFSVFPVLVQPLWK